jgi:hypothetical protein
VAVRGYPRRVVGLQVSVGPGRFLDTLDPADRAEIMRLGAERRFPRGSARCAHPSRRRTQPLLG